MNNLLTNSLIVIALLFVTSCATTIPVIVKLPCPLPLELPKISGGELQVLDSVTYKNITERDIMLVERVKTLRETMKCDE